jgi:molecular chaperone DnaJ
MAATCSSCNGKGRYIPPSSKCGHCNGKGLVREKKSIEVDIPAGIDDGMRVRLARQGDAPLEGEGQNGDLLVEVQVLLIHVTRGVSSSQIF